jgi:hypothetical protein
MYSNNEANAEKIWKVALQASSMEEEFLFVYGLWSAGHSSFIIHPRLSHYGENNRA